MYIAGNVYTDKEKVTVDLELRKLTNTGGGGGGELKRRRGSSIKGVRSCSKHDFLFIQHTTRCCFSFTGMVETDEERAEGEASG